MMVVGETVCLTIVAGETDWILTTVAAEPA